MKKQTRSEIAERIHQYVQGNLSEQETDELWAEITEQPKLLQTLEIQAALKVIQQQNTHTSREDPLMNWIKAAVM